MLDFGITPSMDDDFDMMSLMDDDFGMTFTLEELGMNPTVEPTQPTPPTAAATTEVTSPTTVATSTAREPYCEPKVMKKSKGKQKIEIMKREKKASRQVTFTKRRSGLFRKCHFLCSNYDAQVAVITFSEAGNLYSYGYPNPEDVIQHYVNSCTSNKVISNNNYGVKAEEGRASSSLSYDNDSVDGCWWDKVDIDTLDLSELEKFQATLENLQKEVVSKVDEINRDSTRLVPNNPGFGFGNLGSSRNEVVSRTNNINSDSTSFPNNNPGLRFNSLGSSRNEVGVNGINRDLKSLVPNNPCFRFDNTGSSRNNNEVVPRGANEISRDYSESFVPNIQGLMFNNMDFYEALLTDKGFKSEGFESIKWMNNDMAPQVYQPDYRFVTC